MEKRELKKLTKTKKTLILLFIWFTFYLLIILLDAKHHFLPWGDIKLYEKLGSEFLSGKIPYIDFHFEYPPFSIVNFVMPRIFTADINVYRRIFEILNLLMAFTTTFLTVEISKLLDLKRGKIIWIKQSLIFLILIQLVICRYDTFPMLLAALGIYLYLYGENNKRLYQTLGYVILTLAGLAKLYPFVILPILVFKEFRQRRFKQMVINIAASFLTMLPFIVLMYLGREGIKFFLEYHGNRGLEIESTYSSVLLLLKQLGVISDVNIVYTHASFGIAGVWPNFFANISLTIFLVSYAAISILAFFQNWNKDVGKKIILFSAITISLFVLTNKVFSAQYIVWFFPFLLISTLLFKGIKQKVLIALVVLSSILTMIIYPVFWEVFNKGDLFLTIALLMRNLLLSLITILLVSRISLPKK